jgi:two-component system phosphate regulon sensor histidine kinase PhoR
MIVPYRHSLLFLGAVILPSALVIALGFRMIRQEDALEEKRARERNEHTVELVRQELMTRLESLKLRAASGQVKPLDPDVSLVAPVESGRLVLPWQRRVSSDQDRILRRLHDSTAAAGVLGISPDATDEYGIPFAVYAARRLAAGASAQMQREILERMSRILETRWLSPAAAHMIGDIAKTLHSDALGESAAIRAAEAEQSEQLDLQTLGLDQISRQTVWRLFGSSPWLIGISGLPSDRARVLVAVRAQRMLNSIPSPAQGRWNLTGEGAGVALGESFPGLRLTIPESSHESPARSRQVFYVSGLLLMLSVTLFTSYLLQRDVRREARLTALRAQFVSSVSHELKTPISTIRAFAELIDMGRAKNEREKSEYLKTIVGESERLSRLVDGVLEVSRIDQGKRVYRLQPVILEEVVRSAARALEYPLAQGRFELRISIDPAVPPMLADPEALEQAVMNLLGNAMKYSGEAREIDLTLSRENSHAVIRVRDRGIGIPLEEQSRIFERFYRAPDSGRRNIPGTGLGLALVDHIVKGHGGRVAVESKPEEGSTFSILLPIATTS